MRARLLAAGALALAAVAALPLRADDVRGELRKYKKSIGRPSLYIRTLAIEALAGTHDEAALKELVKRYQRPERPEDHVAYLVAGICAEDFAEASHLDTWRGWLKKQRRAPDAWLWYLGQRTLVKCAASDDAKAALTDPKLDPCLRAAALLALGSAGPADEGLAAVATVLGDAKAMDKLRPAERSAVVAAAASTLVKCKALLGKEAFTRAGTLVIDELDQKDALQHTRWVIARHLAHALDGEQLFLTSEPWRAALLGAAARADRGEPGPNATRLRPVGLGAGATVPRFLGIEGTGTRIAFVIDCSDSMLTPLTEVEKQDLKAGRRPVTGSAQQPQPKEPKEEEDPLAKLPWDRIKTRFDAAREALALSLEELGEKMHFAVITFGTESQALSPSLLPASKANVQATIRSLRRIKVKVGDAERPNGKLQGYTNLHGALLDAFQLTSGPSIPVHEHVDPRAFQEGVDTIFVLSDGAPSWDDFAAVDKNDIDMTSGDPESGAKGGKLGVLNFYGPYTFPKHLARDVVRLNLLRRVELHCVGIGEANAALLEGLAKLGMGEFKSIRAR
ncbi:MAG: hypothetical protein AB7N76_34075 [Planctomycetota bacterium]